MAFKKFLTEAVILEGGAAIKGSHPLTQSEAREITSQVIHDLKVKLNLVSAQIAPVGSAGLKAPDQLSGDIDIAVEADITAVKKAVEELALDGRFRHMPGLNVYSYAKLHGSKTAQVDIIPTTNIKLAKWAYHNDPADLKLGLKGSHRNELLFAIAKYAEYVSKEKDANGEDSARERLVFDLSRGLYRFTQDRAGKKGLKKSFETRDKVLLSSDPDKICDRLLGVPAKAAMTFHEVLKVMLSKTFKHKKKLKQIIDRAIAGLEQKKLVVPHELRVAIISENVTNGELLDLQTTLINELPDDFSIEIEDHGIAKDGLRDTYLRVKRGNQLANVSICKAKTSTTPDCFLISGMHGFPKTEAELVKKLKSLFKVSLDESLKQDILGLQQRLIDSLPNSFNVSVENYLKISANNSLRLVVTYRDDPIGINVYIVYKNDQQLFNVSGSAADFTYDQLLRRIRNDFRQDAEEAGEKLDEGINSDLIELQTKLLDDLPDGFDVDIKKLPQRDEHYVEVNYRDLRSTRVYLGPKLVDDASAVYALDAVSGFKGYNGLLKHLLDKFEYWIKRWEQTGDKLNESRQDLFALQQRLIEDLPDDIRVVINKDTGSEMVELIAPGGLKGDFNNNVRFFIAPVGSGDQASQGRFKICMSVKPLNNQFLRYKDAVYAFLTRAGRARERDALDTRLDLEDRQLGEDVDELRSMALELQQGLIELFDLDPVIKNDGRGCYEIELLNNYRLLVTSSRKYPIALEHFGKPTGIRVGTRTTYDPDSTYQLITEFGTAEKALTWLETWKKDVADVIGSS